MNTNYSLHHLRPDPACSRFEFLLSKEALGLLQPEEARQLQAHLDTCTSCRSRQAEYGQLDTAFRRYFAQSGHTSLRTEDILDALRAREGVHDEDEPMPVREEAPAARRQQTPSELISPPSRVRPRALSSWVAVVAAVLVVALITTGLFASHHSGPQITSQMHPFSTPTPATTPTPAPAQRDPYPPYTGALIWNDPLKDNSQGHSWPEIDQGLGNGCRFAGGAYQVVNAPFDSYTCLERTTNFVYFALQVTVTFVQSSSPQDKAGIIFGRVSNNANTSYVLSLSADGHYLLGACTSADYPGDCSRTLFQGICQSCRVGTAQSNTLAIVVDQDVFTFYANGQSLASATDPTYDPGPVGFYGRASTSTSIVAYRDLQIWEL